MKFEFNVAENLSFNEGKVRGCFAVPSRTFDLPAELAECEEIAQSTNPDSGVIPVILDEYAAGNFLREAIPRDRIQFASLVSFGTGMDVYGNDAPRRTHLAITCREVGSIHPDFLAPFILPPTTTLDKSRDDIDNRSELIELNRQVGTLTVCGDVCIIEV